AVRRETRDAFLVRPRPSAPSPPWCEQETGVRLVERLVDAVDPSVAQRFGNGLVVAEALLAGRGLVPDEPHTARRRVIGGQPTPPLRGGLRVHLWMVGHGHARVGAAAQASAARCASTSFAMPRRASARTS